MHAYAVILAGGSGSRFWPASRLTRPKQLLCLPSDTDPPLLVATVQRLAPLIPQDRVLISTCSALVEPIAALLPGIPRENYLVEPTARNTAPCIGWAASVLAERDPEAVVAVLPSDHLVLDDAAFREALTHGWAGACQGYLTTIGLPPTRPETGYGYIEIGEPLASGVHRVARFVEKPDVATAERLVLGGNHLWNTGVCLFRPEILLTALAEHMPALATGLQRFVQANHASLEEREALFAALPAVSLDYGVLEKASNVAVVPAQFGWSDVGSWQSAWETAPRDPEGNALPTGALALEATGNLVHDTSAGSQERLWVLFGVHDLAVVKTDDAVLILPRNRSQEVRHVVAQLKARGNTKPL